MNTRAHHGSSRKNFTSSSCFLHSTVVHRCRFHTLTVLHYLHFFQFNLLHLETPRLKVSFCFELCIVHSVLAYTRIKITFKSNRQSRTSFTNSVRMFSHMLLVKLITEGIESFYAIAVLIFKSLPSSHT